MTSESMPEIVVGDLRIRQEASHPNVLATNMVGENLGASLTSFVFTNPDGCVLLAGLYEFEDGSALFRGIEKIAGPEPYSRVLQAGRVEVQKWGDDLYSSRIRALKSVTGDHPNLAGLTWEELAKLAEVQNAQTLLKEYGAISLGTAGEIISVTNKNKNQLAMTYPRADVRSLAVMWGITRVTAIAKKFGMQGYQGQ